VLLVAYTGRQQCQQGLIKVSKAVVTKAVVPTRSVKALHVLVSAVLCPSHGVQLPASTATGVRCSSCPPPSPNTHGAFRQRMNGPCAPSLRCADGSDACAVGCTRDNHHACAMNRRVPATWKAVRCMQAAGDMPAAPLASSALLPLHRHSKVT
jgi:hypothetical protein